MTLIVEDGTGILKANSYVGLSYAYNYLSSRNRVVTWVSASREAQEAALISATDYVDKRFGMKFLGDRLVQNLPTFGSNFAIITELPVEDSTIQIGDEVYTFKETSSGPTEIAIGVTVSETATNIANVLSVRADVNASSLGSIVNVEAADVGPSSISTLSNTSAVVFEYSKLTGGTLVGSQPLEFPRTAFIGMPGTLKMATVEYALRALSETLMPDPVVDESGRRVSRKLEKVGPIEEEIAFETTAYQIFKTFPEADRLIKPLITEVGGVYR